MSGSFAGDELRLRGFLELKERARARKKERERERILIAKWKFLLRAAILIEDGLEERSV